jgi:hypothetical protein
MADNLVALRDHRELIIARLSDAYAQDLFEVEELERRLDLAHAATSLAALDALVADLAPVARAPSTALVVAGPTAIDDPARAASKPLRVIFGSVERRGRWTVPRRLDLGVWLGHAELDFRDASVAAGTTTIDVNVVMGNFEIILPPNLAIDVDVSSILGSVTERHRVPPDADPARPVIRIVGKVWFGNLEITTRLPGESAWDARRRERRERKALRAGARKALPPG